MQPWYTKRANDYTTKSHISHSVHDSRWEASTTFELERNNEVESWAKNDHLGFEIQYVYDGLIRKYYPDYLIRLKNGIMPILEIKGQDSQENQIKREALAEWVEAINENGGFGTWVWDIAFSPSEVRPIIVKHMQSTLSCRINAKCPACGKIASTRTEVMEVFGLKNINGIIHHQVWCKDCMQDRARWYCTTFTIN